MQIASHVYVIKIFLVCSSIKFICYMRTAFYDLIIWIFWTLLQFWKWCFNFLIYVVNNFLSSYMSEIFINLSTKWSLKFYCVC